MKLGYLFAMLFALSVPQTGFAQEFRIDGYVIDEADGSPLQYTVIGIPELELWDLTDEKGYFELPRVEEGFYQFIALRRGYYMAVEVVQFEGATTIMVDMTEEDPDQPLGPGNLVGQVTDAESGRPVSGVEVSIVPTDQSATTDGQGRFEIDDISAGALALEFRRMGYEPRTDTLASLPGITLEINVTMSAQPILLDPVVVNFRNRYLEGVGFYRRMRSQPGGTRFDQEEIDRRNPVVLTDLFRTVPSVRTGRDEFGSAILTSNRGGGCELSVWIDGSRTPGFDLSTYPPQWVAAIEIYVGMSVPARFMDQCGVVLIWSRK